MSKEDALSNLVATLTETNAKLLERLEAMSAPRATTPMSHNEQFEAQIKAFRAPPGPPDVVIPGVRSPMTDSTFNAVIQRGIVVRLDGYVLDESYRTYVKDGGKVPDGMIMVDLSVHGGKPKAYKEWLSTVYPKDNLFFVGKPFPEYLRPKPATDQAAE